VHSGHDALGEVFVRVDFSGLLFNGRAASTDIITGSVSAYIEALNRAQAAKKRKDGQ
jgi:2-isopropylmalate synthase